MAIDLSKKIDGITESNYFYALDSGNSRAKGLAPFIKAVSLRIGWWENNTLNLGKDSRYIFLGAVQTLPNLETVRLSSVSISPTIVTWFTTLPKLRSLSLDYCWLCPGFEDSGASVAQSFTKVCQQALTALHPSSLGGYDSMMHKILEIRNPSPPLTSLFIDLLTHDMSLADILNSLPTLVDLTLVAISLPESPDSDTPEPLFTFSETCVPCLAKLKCPLEALSSFARYHLTKLRYLDIAGPTGKVGFSASSLSSASLEELRLATYTCLGPPFDVPSVKNLPRLQALSIEGYVKTEEQRYRRLLKHIATSCSSVKELRLNGIHPESSLPDSGQIEICPPFIFDLPRQRDMISVLTDDGQLSGLTRVALDAYFTWVRVQGAGEECDWRPFIPAYERSMEEFDDIVLRAIRDPEVFRDYKGWIGRALAL